MSIEKPSTLPSSSTTLPASSTSSFLSISPSISSPSATLPTAHNGRIHRKHRRRWRDDRWGCNRLGCCRWCALGCSLFWVLLAGFLLAFFLWARMPTVDFSGVENTNFAQVGNGFLLQFTLGLLIHNPNFIGITIKSLTATAYHPALPHTLFAQGHLEDASVQARGPSTIHFPMSLNYSQTADPSSLILSDLADRCGILGNPKSKIEIRIIMDITLRVAATPLVIPQIRAPISLDCPTEFNSSLPLGGVVNLLIALVPLFPSKYP
ncbi:MAG: hypothetical protein DHS80DRAFT_25533 [Piptocephalis tieghemiana]|nr:MAG: hypothetical protein DHS80DRAFT_25533 [Piptocephalis tieghemiana]